MGVVQLQFCTCLVSNQTKTVGRRLHKPIRLHQISGELAPNSDAAQQCKSKQATMVRTCQKMIKELTTRAQPSRAKHQNVNLATHKKKNRFQPPPASPHRSLLKLHRVVPLFDMRVHTSKNIHDIIMSSRGALPIQKLTTIATGRLSKVEEDPNGIFKVFFSCCFFFLSQFHRGII